MTIVAIDHNDHRYTVEGTFDLSSAGAVLAISYPAGQTKTVRGKSMSVVKNGTGIYDVTIKLSSTISGPTFQAVELVQAHSFIISATVGAATTTRVSGVSMTTAGDVLVKILTMNNSAAAADTTVAITVGFSAIFIYSRMDQAI